MKATTAQLIAAYQELKTTAKVAALYGTTHSNVVQRLHNAGYALRAPGRRREEA